MQNRIPESFLGVHLITLITGPMFAGKSQELLNKLHRHEIVGHSILLINSLKDNRISTGEGNAAGIISTHREDSFFLKSAKQIAVDNLSNIEKDLISEADAIGIDEGQFFSDIELVIEWSIRQRKIVYVAGLMSTSEGKIFGEMYKLLPFSTLIQLSAVCEMCYKQYGIIVDAKLTKCLQSKENIELIGSSSYIPVCLSHWL